MMPTFPLNLFSNLKSTFYEVRFLHSVISTEIFSQYTSKHTFLIQCNIFLNSNSNNMVDFTTLMSWTLLLTTCNNLRTFKVIKKEINREICQNCQPNKLAWSKKDQISLSGFCSTTHVLHIPIQVAGQY